MYNMFSYIGKHSAIPGEHTRIFHPMSEEAVDFFPVLHKAERGAVGQAWIVSHLTGSRSTTQALRTYRAPKSSSAVIWPHLH